MIKFLEEITFVRSQYEISEDKESKVANGRGAVAAVIERLDGIGFFEDLHYITQRGYTIDGNLHSSYWEDAQGKSHYRQLGNVSDTQVMLARHRELRDEMLVQAQAMTEKLKANGINPKMQELFQSPRGFGDESPICMIPEASQNHGGYARLDLQPDFPRSCDDNFYSALHAWWDNQRKNPRFVDLRFDWVDGGHLKHRDVPYKSSLFVTIDNELTYQTIYALKLS